MKTTLLKSRLLSENLLTRILAFAILSSVIFGTYQVNAQSMNLDLFVNSITLSPDAVEPGKDSLTINVSYGISGIYDEYYGPYIEYYISEDSIFSHDDLPIGKSDLRDNISSSISYKNVIPYAKPGKNYIIAGFDFFPSLPELNEFNNYAVESIEVLSTPIDLFPYIVPTIINFSSAPGQKFPLSHDIQNIGYIKPDSLKVGIYLSEDTIFQSEQDIFLQFNYETPFFQSWNKAHLRDTVQLPDNIPLGNYFILTVIDPEQLYDEMNEENNVRAFNLTVSEPFVDLEIYSGYASFDFNPDSAGSQIVKAEYTFRNNGNATINAFSTAIFLSKDLKLDDDDLMLGIQYQHPLFGNQTYSNRGNFGIPAGIQEGEYFVIFYLDYYKDNPVINPDNNLFFKEIIGGVWPNLILLPASSLPLIANESFGSHSVYIKNTGHVPAYYPSVGHFIVSAQGEYLEYLGETQSEILSSGQIEQHVINFNLPYEGVFFIRSWADSYNFMPESNDFDNTLDQKIIYYNITSLDKANEKGEISISPNPAQESFTIFNGLESGIVTYDLYNNFGEIVRSQKADNSRSVHFDCSGIAKGIYFLKTESDGKLKQQKVVLY